MDRKELMRLSSVAKCVAFLLNFTSNLDDPADGPKYVRIMVRAAVPGSWLCW